MGVESGSLQAVSRVPPPAPLRVHTAALQRAPEGPRGPRLVAGGIPACMASGRTPRPGPSLWLRAGRIQKVAGARG